MTDIKKIYDFASWPAESILAKDDINSKINFRLDTDTGFRLIDHLSQCVAPGLPQITDRLDECSADIAFGAFDGSGQAISAVRGNALIMIRNIGSKSIDLIPLYSTVHDRINLMRQRKSE